ncbi:hypothetical protein SAMD00019534_058690 [Acytostelium subglobosum LB1]|uniref:hypothetical protein n=1 Tax=Acytostelium subglobosum LB1 TaxID=1410327 RepID=UPI000644DB21|nr:hypothetical protein SAMD00019534_058690 [Acytostelium subglobosum LB1]GAM22694.1 hypothetical protein SAMD00019534_058690 [Acytostelium subglobosum LB1]|eukprot:XP_012754814.1 hypothetical protein SAMD00019534_058690 [Acytostelium subglobosum LB1]
MSTSPPTINQGSPASPPMGYDIGSPGSRSPGDTAGRRTLKSNVVKSLLNRSNSGSTLINQHRRQFPTNNTSDDGGSIDPSVDSPKSSRRAATATAGTGNSAADNDVDKSLWTVRALKENPEIADIFDRIKPINRCISLGQCYAYEETLLKDDPLIGNDVMLQLILQHLQYEGLLNSRKSLEGEANVKYPDYAFNDSRLVTLIRTALKDSERIFSLTLDDRQKDSQQLLEEHLALMGLLAEEPDTSEDVNIYDEALESNIIYTDETQANPASSGSNNNNSSGNLGTSGNVPISSVQSNSSFTLSTSAKLEPIKAIKAASLNKLVILLTPEKNHDLEYAKTFLLTYQSFTTNEKLLQKLIQRYQVPQRPGQSDDEWKKIAIPIQLRVVNVLKTWINQSFSEFNDKLIQNIKSFVEVLKHDNLALANRIMQTLNSKIKGIGGEDDEEDKKSKIVFTMPAPEPKVPKNIWSTSLTIFDVDEEEVARQLTLIDFEIFSSIKPSELLNQSWNKPKLRHRSPNVMLIINRFNEISQWVASIILSFDKVKDRARVMSKIVKIAEYLMKPLNNFNTSMAILSGLNAASVHRLKFTKEEMPKHIQVTLADLQGQLSSAQAYKTYRDILAKSNPPCLPYLGVCLTDLTFIEEGNPDLIKGFINFSKRKLIYNAIFTVQSFQNTRYNLHPVYQISKLLRVLKPRIDEEDLYRRSLKFEPRNKERNEIL